MTRLVQELRRFFLGAITLTPEPALPPEPPRATCADGRKCITPAACERLKQCTRQLGSRV